MIKSWPTNMTAGKKKFGRVHEMSMLLCQFNRTQKRFCVLSIMLLHSLGALCQVKFVFEKVAVSRQGARIFAIATISGFGNMGARKWCARQGHLSITGCQTRPITELISICWSDVMMKQTIGIIVMVAEALKSASVGQILL